MRTTPDPIRRRHPPGRCEDWPPKHNEAILRKVFHLRIRRQASSRSVPIGNGSTACRTVGRLLLVSYLCGVPAGGTLWAERVEVRVVLHEPEAGLTWVLNGTRLEAIPHPGGSFPVRPGSHVRIDVPEGASLRAPLAEGSRFQALPDLRIPPAPQLPFHSRQSLRSETWATLDVVVLATRSVGGRGVLDILANGERGLLEIQGPGPVVTPRALSVLRATGVAVPPQVGGGTVSRPFRLLVDSMDSVRELSPDLSPAFPGPFNRPVDFEPASVGEGVQLRGTVTSVAGSDRFEVELPGRRVAVEHSLPRQPRVGALVEMVGELHPPGAGNGTWRLARTLFREMGNADGGTAGTLVPVIQSIEEVRRLTPEMAGRKIPVAVVAAVTGDYTRFGERVLFLQDETGGIYSYPGTNVANLAIGEDVLVVGTTGAGLFVPEILAGEIRPLGTRRAIRTTPAEIGVLKSGLFDSQWVEIAGVVTRVWFKEGTSRLELTDGVESIEVRIGSKEPPAHLLETLVQLKGVAATEYNPRRQAVGAFLWCPSETFIHSRETAGGSPFEAPAKPIAWLRNFHQMSGGPARARVRGVLTAVAPDGRAVVQSGFDAILVQAVSPVTEAPGTEVDVAGLIGWSGARLELRRAQIRALGPAEMPPAEPFRARSAQAEFDGMRAQVEGKVLSVNREEGRMRLLLMEDTPVQVIVPRFTNRLYQADLAPGMRIRAEGARLNRFDSKGKVDGHELLLGLPTDLRILERAPLLTFGNIVATLGSAGVAAFAGFAWMKSLRSKVRQQAAEIDARYRLQAELERRNAELVEQAGEVIFELEPSGRIRSANPAAGRLFNRPVPGLVDVPLPSLAQAEDRPRLLEALEAAARGAVERVQFAVSTGGPAERWLELRIQSFGTQGGQPLLGAVGRDVTDRKQAELALRQSEQNLRRIIEFLPDGVVLLDDRAVIRFQNRRAGMLLAYPADGLVGRPVGCLRNATLETWVVDLLHSSDLGNSIGRSGDLQTLVLGRMEGPDLLADVSIGLVRRSDSRSCLVSFRDASTRIAAEETLRSQAMMARVESEVSRIVGLADDPETLLRRCSEVLVSLAGATVVRVWIRGNRDAEARLVAAVADRDFPHDPSALGEPAGICLELLTGVGEGGQVLHLAAEPGMAIASQRGLTTCSLHPFPAGELGHGVLEVYSRSPVPALVAGNLLVITSALAGGLLRVQAVAQLNRSNSKLRALLDSTPVAIVELDSEGRVLNINPAAEALFRNTREQARGLAFRVLSGCDEATGARVLEVGRGAGPLSALEVALSHRDGSTTPCSLYAASTGSAGGTASETVCVLVDLTERRRIEAESEGIQRKLRDAQRLESLGVMAGGIAHDFNNILGSILGNANLAAAAAAGRSDVLEPVHEIERGAQRAGELCRLMLAYAGQAGIGKQSADLNEIVRDTLRLLRHGISKLAEVRLDLAEPLPWTPLDTAQVRQVVMNLVANASDALGDQPGVIRIRTAVHDPSDTSPPGAETKAGRHVLLEVCDTGCGMEESVVSRIFDPFFTTKFAGRGLGLAAVWGVVRGHEGQIGVHSVPGVGSTFRVWLPAPETAAPIPAAPKPNPPAGASDTKKGLVVLVDDEAPLRRVTRQLLQRFGYEVVESADGVEGLEAVLLHRSRDPLVMLDVTMPRLGGAEVLARIRREAREIRVVMMSGYAAGGTSGQGFPDADGFLSKPFNTESLVRVLREADERRRSRT
jgi:two-component system cell cycle sensor histidine kinase/response regulator CckA